MRRLVLSIVVAVATTALPVWAMAGNQEVAERVAAHVQEGGQFAQNCKIGVKFQTGTLWLRGHVADAAQMERTVRLASEIPEVEQVINEMTFESAEPMESAQAADLKMAAGALSAEMLALRNESSLASSSDTSRLAEVRRQEAAADRLATSFTHKPVEPVSSVVPEETREQVSTHPPRISQRRMTPAVANPAVASNAANAVAYQPGPPLPIRQAGAQAMPQYATPMPVGVTQARYDQPQVPNYSWPSYAAHPNYAAVTYPKQHSPTAWPYIGPFYPYPQVPLGWRKVTMEWHDGWWQLDFDNKPHDRGILGGLFRFH